MAGSRGVPPPPRIAVGGGAAAASAVPADALRMTPSCKPAVVGAAGPASHPGAGQSACTRVRMGARRRPACGMCHEEPVACPGGPAQAGGGSRLDREPSPARCGRREVECIAASGPLLLFLVGVTSWLALAMRASMRAWPGDIMRGVWPRKEAPLWTGSGTTLTCRCSRSTQSHAGSPVMAPGCGTLSTHTHTAARSWLPWQRVVATPANASTKRQGWVPLLIPLLASDADLLSEHRWYALLQAAAAVPANTRDTNGYEIGKNVCDRHLNRERPASPARPTSIAAGRFHGSLILAIIISCSSHQLSSRILNCCYKKAFLLT